MDAARLYTYGVPRVALTFDDGPGPDTAALLDVLGAAAWPATFFVLGRNVAEAPWCGDPARAKALVVRALAAGHVVGNHSYSHAQPIEYLGFAADVRRAQEVIDDCRRTAGVNAAAPCPFRLPYGVRFALRTMAVDTGTLAVASLDPRLPVAAALGLCHTHWTSDFADWTLGEHDGPALAARMLEHVHDNAALGLDAVLCLHDGGTGSRSGYRRPATVDAVARFLAEARGRGYEPFTAAAAG
jgi:chitin deacetylase